MSFKFDFKSDNPPAVQLENKKRLFYFYVLRWALACLCLDAP